MDNELERKALSLLLGGIALLIAGDKITDERYKAEWLDMARSVGMALVAEQKQ